MLANRLTEGVSCAVQQYRQPHSPCLQETFGLCVSMIGPATSCRSASITSHVCMCDAARSHSPCVVALAASLWCSFWWPLLANSLTLRRRTSSTCLNSASELFSTCG